MIEILSSVGNWFVRNGSASDWFTSFGTIGAVAISLQLARSQSKTKAKVKLSKYVEDDKIKVRVINKKPIPLGITTCWVVKKKIISKEEIGEYDQFIYQSHSKENVIDGTRFIPAHKHIDFFIYKEDIRKLSKQANIDKFRLEVEDIYGRKHKSPKLKEVLGS